MNKIKTTYGHKQFRKSPFIIVAPHGAGDDLKTPTISRQLAEELGASLIVNRRFFKKDNHRAEKRPEFIEDFNELCWSFLKNKYLWRSKKVAMKEFFDDINTFCHLAKKHNKNEAKAIVIYIHGINNPDIGIDLGVGIKAKGDNNKFIESLKSNINNSGKVTLKISYLKKIRKLLATATKEKFNLPVSVGKIFIGWSKKSAIQFHKHEDRNDYALQIEINHILRNKENRPFLLNLLAESLNKTFN